MRNSKIGGQAVIEGVMMRGESAAALACRDEKGEIRIKTWRLKPKSVWRKIPIIRGVVSFLGSISEGTKTLMDSANVFGEEEPSKFEQWVAKKFKVDLINVVIIIAAFLGLALAVGLFIVLPAALSSWTMSLFDLTSNSVRVWIEAGLKLVILFCYILLTSLLGDIKRVYMYHGAEHKTLNCYEHELELTVENVRNSKKFHNRCGTTFLFFVVLVGVVVTALINIENNEVLRVLVKIALLPLTAGIAYELLMFVAKAKSPIFYPLKLPGMLLQKITTKEPDDKMIEVAITSFNAVLELDADKALPIYDRFTFKYASDVKREGKKILTKAKVEFDADIDWVLVHVLEKKRSEISNYTKISIEEYDKAIKIIKERATGKPLWHILGYASFYGIDLISDSRGLIPRPETEELLLLAIKEAEGKNTILDLCTGSGAIAIALAKNTELKVTAVDYSDAAIELTNENINKIGVEVEVVKSDMFTELAGRKFDIIVSNPPYIPTKDIDNLQNEVKKHEPMMALDGGEDGLDFYRIIAKNSKNHLNEGGVVLMEIGINQSKDVMELFSEYKDVEVKVDMLDVERIIIGRM